MTKTELIVCTTCGYADRDEQGRSRGERLQRALADRLGAQAESVEVHGAKCFMACDRRCNVHLRADGKMSYLIGDLDADNENALASLLEYVDRYRESDTGVVPYGKWPEGIGKRFVCRIPPR